MQHVVVATDLTSGSEPALDRAAFASSAMGANLRLLHVLPDLLPPLVGEIRTRRAEGVLRYRSAGLGRRFGAPVSCGVKRGSTPRRIVRESEDVGAVLTVFGHSAGRQRVRRLMGTTPEQSLKLIRNAMLIVCGRSSGLGGYRKALLAPGGGFERAELMPYLDCLAPEAAVHWIEPPGRASGRSDRRKAEDHIRAMRRALDADLLVIGMPHDRTLNPFRFRQLLPSLVRAPECDTLIVPPECDVKPTRMAEPKPIRMTEPKRIRIAS